MHVNTLIELAIQKTERKSLRSLAERIEVSSSKVSEWKTGQAPIPETRIVQLAKLAGQDAGPWLLLIKSDQAEGEVEREWAKLAKRLATTAALALCVMTTTLPGTVQAATAGVQAGASSAGMYIMFNLRWAWHLVSLWLGSRLRKPTRPYIEARI